MSRLVHSSAARFLAPGVFIFLLVAACTPAPAAPGAAATATSARTAPATGETSTGVQEVTVVAQDIAFSQKQLTLKAGVPTRLVLVNQGAVEHDVTIPGLAAGGTADAHGQQEAGHSMGAMAPGTVHATARAGDRAVVEFTPKAGTYELFCSIPGHKDAGMQGTLRVQ